MIDCHHVRRDNALQVEDEAMDLSKLPRMSQTPAPPATPEPPQAETAPHDYGIHERASVGPEIWISAIIGLIFLLIGRNFASYLAHVATGRTYHTNVNWVAGPKVGTEVSYPELQGHVMMNDSAMFLFGLALVLEAAVFLALGMNWRLQRPLIYVGFAVAALATIYNAIVAVILFNDNVLPIFSLLAVAFGGYAALFLWRLRPAR
jgi:hypothetical protein